jgi:nucleoid DNA-binding protein
MEKYFLYLVLILYRAKSRKERLVRNPKTGGITPPGKKVSFKPTILLEKLYRNLNKIS